MSTLEHGPLVDEQRGRLLLAPDHVRALAGPDPDGEDLTAAREQLVAGGLVEPSGALHPLVADFAACMLTPTVQVLVETTGRQGTLASHVVVSGQDVWSTEPWPGQQPDAAVVHSRSELPTLLWDLARLVGLRRRTPPADAVAVEATVGQVDIALAVLERTSPEVVGDLRLGLLSLAAAATEGLPAAARARWAALLAELRGSWRVTVAWGDPLDGRGGVRALHVLDSGPEGYWARTGPAEPLAEQPAADAPLRLEPLSAGQVWDALAALLPSGAELRAAAPVSA